MKKSTNKITYRELAHKCLDRWIDKQYKLNPNEYGPSIINLGYIFMRVLQKAYNKPESHVGLIDNKWLNK